MLSQPKLGIKVLGTSRQKRQSNFRASSFLPSKALTRSGGMAGLGHMAARSPFLASQSLILDQPTATV